MAERRKSASAVERLQRLLFIVPYVVQHPGVPIDELVRLSGVPEDELLRDLSLLFVTGAYPYGPGDLIDVSVEDGTVTITMADYFARPLRITRTEAIALYLEATAAAAQLGEDTPIRSAIAKLADGLGDEAVAQLAQVVEATPAAPPTHLADVMDAADRHHRLSLRYYAASTGEVADRSFEPEAVFSELGNWYTAGWDVGSGAERLLRIDRILGLRDTGEAFEPRGITGHGRPLYDRGPEDAAVLLRLEPEAAWVAEYYAVDGTIRRDDGALEVTVPAGRLEWVERLVLRHGGAIQVLEPQALVERVRALAGRVRELYR